MTDRPKDKPQRPEDGNSTALAIPSFGLPSIFEDFMRPFDEWMRPPSLGQAWPMWAEAGEREPVIDVQDRGEYFVLTAEFPGFDKKDIEVRVDANGLELKAARKSEKESKTADGSSRQSSYSLFHRYLTLPAQILSERVVGTMKNGVLELRLPKKEPAKDKSRKVDLK